MTVPQKYARPAIPNLTGLSPEGVAAAKTAYERAMSEYMDRILATSATLLTEEQRTFLAEQVAGYVESTLESQKRA